MELKRAPLCLLAKAVYSVTYRRDENRQFNLPSFNNYKRFGSESTIKLAAVSEPSVIRQRALNFWLCGCCDDQISRV